MRRRQFLGAAAAGALLTQTQDVQAQRPDAPEAIRRLRPMTSGITPISDAEREARMERARRLMVEAKINAIFLEPGSTMSYFTGIRWGLSERMFGMVLPARGEVGYVVPGFEE